MSANSFDDIHSPAGASEDIIYIPFTIRAIAFVHSSYIKKCRERFFNCRMDLKSTTNKSQVPRSNIPATGSHMILQERCGKVTGSHRKAPEIAGSGSSIPTGNLLDFFPVDSDQFPVLSSRNRSEIIGKNPKIFRLEYCFHVPVTSGAFLPEPARIFRPG